MRKRWNSLSRPGSAGLVSLGILCGVVACVEPGGSLLIIQAQIPETKEGACLIPSDRGKVRLVDGTLDVGLDRPRPYYFYPLIANLLPKLSNGGNEPNRVDVNAVQVRVEPPPGLNVAWKADCPVLFDWATPLTLFPGEENSALVEALRACHAEVIRSLFETGVLDSRISTDIRFRVILRAKGHHGGTQIISDSFEFPIRVCRGCLQTGFSDAQFAGFSVDKIPACEDLSANPYKGNPCNPAQDFGPLLCCAVEGNNTRIECPGLPRKAAPASTTP